MARKYENVVKTTSIEQDAHRQALPAGKRKSKNGKIYYEYRTNHADYPAENESWESLLSLKKGVKHHSLGVIISALNHEYETARIKKPKTTTKKTAKKTTATRKKTSTAGKKENLMQYAKRTRKPHETWKNAIKRAAKELK